MSQTYRSYPEIQQVFTFLGPVLAFALEAIKESAFPADEWDRTHPRPRDRVAFLRARVQVAEGGGLLPLGTVAAGDSFWRLFSDFLSEATAVPEAISDPVAELLTGATRNSTWNDAYAVNSILQWCAFGSVTTVGESLRRASCSEMKHPTSQSVIRYLLAETKHIEPTLGLARQLTLPLPSRPETTQYKEIARHLISEQLDTLSAPPVENDLMRMWMYVLFQTIAIPIGTGGSVASLLAEQIAADTTFATSAQQCSSLVQGLMEKNRRAKLFRDAAEARVPRIVVLTTWLVDAFESGWQQGAKEVDTYRPMRVAKLMVMFGFLMRRDVPEIVSSLLDEWSQRI